MEQRFVHLRQYDRTVDAYAAEFLRLSRFAPSMVKDEEDRANRFQQGLRLEIQKFLAPQQLDTYSQVLTAARRVEMVANQESRSRGVGRQVKRPFGQAFRGALATS